MRNLALVIWLAATVGGAVLGGQIFDHAAEIDELSPAAESMRAAARLAQWEQEGPVIIVVTKDRDPYDPELVASVQEVTRALEGVAKVESLYNSAGGMIGKDARSTMVRAELLDLAKQDYVVARLREIKAPTVLVGGELLAKREFADTAVRDAAIGESIAFAVLALVLVIFLKRRAWIPLVTAVATIAVTLLLLRGLSMFTTVSEFAVNVVTLLGLGLSVDYALLILWRHREDGDVGKAYRAVVVSGSAVAVALLGLMAFAEPLLAAMAMGGLVAVIVATTAALTLVPALLPRHQPHQISTSALVARTAGFAVARPVKVAALSAGVLVILALPFAGARLHNSDARALPEDSQSRQVQEEWLHTFLQRPEPVTVVMERDSGGEQMRDYLNRLNTLDGVMRLELRLEMPAGKTVIDLTPQSQAQAPAVVRAVRSTAAPAPILVGGPAAEVVDYQDAVLRRLPIVLAILFAATLGLLYLLTGSLIIGIKALLLNLLSLGASLGVLALVFGDLDLTTPVLLFVFIFGLTMDYEVFLMARISEEHRKTGDNAAAVIAGLSKSGPVVTAAALCLVVVFLGFVIGDLRPVREIGVGMAVALIIDVTLVRGLLLPASMTLLGRWNWWPYRQRSDASLPQRASGT